jgi:hypothetical protein
MTLTSFSNSCIKSFGIFLIITAFSGIITADSNVTYQSTDTQKELTEKLEGLIEQLRQERADYYIYKAQNETEIQKARENHKVLQDELNELRLREAEYDQEILKYKEEVEDINKKLIAKTALENILHEQVQPFLINQKIIIENGIPYKQKERLARLEAAYGRSTQRLTTGNSDTNEPNRISAADYLENIWNYSLEELRIGRSSETYTLRAKTGDNALPYARYFRVGHLISGYVTEDGRQTAMWLSQRDKYDFSVTKDRKQSEQIRKTVEILDHLQPPELVELAVSLKFTKAEENSNAAD